MKKNTSCLPTLSIKHNEIISGIQKLENSIPLLEERKQHLISMNNYEGRDNGTAIASLNNFSTELAEIDNSIAKIKKMRLDYFIKNADIIFEYNEIDKSNIGIPGQFQTESSSIPIATFNSSLKQNPPKKNSCFKNKNTVINSKMNANKTASKASLLKKYLLNNDPNYNHLFQQTSDGSLVTLNEGLNENTYCFKCNRYRDLNEHEAKLVCYICGESIPVILESDKPSSKDYPTESRHYEYKKFNHFCYWLAKIQGKESCDIPPEVIETIKRDIKRDKITDLTVLDETDIKEYLKKYKSIGYDKYYNHTIFILMEITGNPPIVLSLEQEKEYKMMFIIIQELYEIYKPDDRSNFGSYSYIIYKFAQLRNDVEIMKKMKLLKCKEKLHNLDIIWKKICNHLGGADKGWKFIPTY